MAIPIVLCAAVLLLAFLRLSVTCSLSGSALLETTLPLILRLLFLLYPLVTNVAFEAFSCYEFDNGTSAYLVSDVSIACSTPVPFGPIGGADGTTSELHVQVMAIAEVLEALSRSVT